MASGVWHFSLNRMLKTLIFLFGIMHLIKCPGRAYHHSGAYDQLDRSPDFEFGGCGFESRHAGHMDKKSKSLNGPSFPSLIFLGIT